MSELVACALVNPWLVSMVWALETSTPQSLTLNVVNELTREVLPKEDMMLSSLSG
jgi:hypothetical protein